MKTAYTVVRGERKTLAVEITRDLRVVVRVPRHLPRREIDRLVAARAEWIEAHLALQRERAAACPEPTEAEALLLRRKAAEVLPARVAHFAALMGVCPTGITITGAVTRHGSCSAKDRLCFSWRLLRYPPAAVDYVVVHELAHIRHKNHGPDFYRFVASVLPDHLERRKMLGRGE